MKKSKYCFLLIALLFYVPTFFGQGDTTINNIEYRSNESLIIDYPTLHRQFFDFVNLANYQEIYLVQTIGERTSMEYYLIKDSVVEKIEFSIALTGKWEFKKSSINFSGIQIDQAKFFYEVVGGKSGTCTIERWIQHVRNGEIVSSVFLQNYNANIFRSVSIPNSKNFINNVLTLEEQFR